MSHVHQYNLRPRKRREGEESPEYQLSGDLPLEILEVIFGYLDDERSRIRFSGVCRTWRWVGQQCRNSNAKSRQHLWLLLRTEPEEVDRRDFFSFSDGGITHSLHLPEARAMQCCGSSQGWLVMQNHTKKKVKKVILLHPLSRAKISLPVTTRVVKSSVSGSKSPRLPMPRIYKAILSSAPDQSLIDDDADFNNDDCLVAAIDCDGHLHLCRPGDRSWTRQHRERYSYFRYKDILFYQQKLYGVSRRGIEFMILSFSPDLNFKAERFTAPSLDLLYHLSWYRYLAECCGKIVLVFGAPERPGSTAVGLRVCELDSRAENFVDVKSLDDGVLILDHKSCRYSSSKDLAGVNFQSNAIYLADSCFPFYHAAAYSRNATNVFELKETGVFHLEGGISKGDPFLRRPPTALDVPSIWYTSPYTPLS